MGLAGPKNRTKLSKDPNNTTWSNATDRFGHKILTSQGWTPGSTLGAADAAHAEHYTAASSAHIRVLLKDDNLGLGAKRVRDDQFGLDVFQNLLGRLNGKGEDVLAKEEEGRRDLNLRLYQTQRFGNMQFVSGGFLVGDKIEQLRRKEVEARFKGEAVVVKKEEDDEVVVKEEEDLEDEPKERKRKRKRGAENSETSLDSEQAKAEEKARRKEKKDKKKSGVKTEVSVKDDPDAMDTSEVPVVAITNEKEEKRKRRAEKKARKEAKRLRKEEKAKKRAAKQKDESASESEASESFTSATPVVSASATPLMSNSATPSGTSTPTAFVAGNGRNIVRQRFIQQKRMACMDPKALAEIFMIKATT